MAAAGEEAYTEASIRAALKAKLSPSRLAVVDNSGGCGLSFVMLIVSDGFSGELPLKRQRKVHEALGEEAMAAIHAVEIQALTEAQFQKRHGEGKFPPALIAALQPPLA
ncbi:hypothetical protein FNF27_01465 [Cafeteria roenbergensis]|uniref:BolA-like protein n=2 Tax=Cafeteria roenbergensis TaxID=33653 RepID=A0A5A8BYE4_CAFRO|nr:hypothetical protein FNF28_07833 [Cafeteria roenbergensis]KAA0147129.1 hypothetical protein FNF29_07619 [Cafeteria roenbergensis]KAA0160530.1 hypothetical protein FNF31_04239 [Cafeteria roenbergensis]KAA0177135.1 hypothetical protein FNF27_01465 [Cafeteria roenbergensis]|eukprot:KAA0147129.1 hypothetical protein FNF29_07619 [Cafeteria roenbergensis]